MMGNKTAIPEGYGLVRSINPPHVSIVENVKAIREVTGRSIGQSKEVLAQETPFLLTLEEITNLQDAGFGLYYETYEQQQARIKREKAQKELEKKIKIAEDWYETLSEEEQSYVDLLIDLNLPFD